MDDWLVRFREAIARLNPAANPRHALRENLYVDPPGGSLAHELSAALQLAPSSAHLVVGSVGSGKSTELLAAESMATAPDTRAVYVDVSRMHDLSSDLTGVLLVLAGLAVAHLVRDVKDAEVQAARSAFRDWAFGYREFVPQGYDDELPEDFWGDDAGYNESRPGVLRPPVPAASWAVKERMKQLAVLRSALPEPLRHVVLLFDSMDPQAISQPGLGTRHPRHRGAAVRQAHARSRDRDRATDPEGRDGAISRYSLPRGSPRASRSARSFIRPEARLLITSCS